VNARALTTVAGYLLVCAVVLGACDDLLPYRGISMFDENNVPGEQDPDDWRPDGVISGAHVYPNPMADHGRLILGLSDSARVSVRIQASAARVVRHPLLEKALATGVYLFPWDGRDDDGNACSDGIYRVFITAVKGDSTFDAYGDVQIQHTGK
jgi:hypothetical protein